MLEESGQIESRLSKDLTIKTPPETGPAQRIDHQDGSDPTAQRSKLSVNVQHDLSERLRSLAYTHRLSESSIVEVALTMFFARGDDAILGVILKELGAVLRRK